MAAAAVRTPGLVLVGVLLAALAVLVAALAVSGGAPEPAPGGLPDAGPGTGWAVPVLRLLHHVAAVAVVGVLLLGLLPAVRAEPPPPVPTAALVLGALSWAAATAGLLLVGLSEAVGRPVRAALQPDLVASYVQQVATGGALMQTAVLALAVGLAAPVARWPAGRAVLLAVALVALLPPVRAGHAATAQDHQLAVWSLAVHVLAVTLWIGGLTALAVTRRSERLARAVPRFSALALGCFIGVTLSGMVSAWTRLPEPAALWSTGYGGLLLGKATLLLALGAVGRRHRRATVPAVSAGRVGAFRSLALAEVGLMATALALAVALTRTSP